MMNNPTYNRISTVLKEFNLRSSDPQFQKLIHSIVFLVQQEGILTKYPFQISSQGVWSPILLKDINDNIVTYVELTDKERAIIETVQKSIYKCNEINVDLLDWAEYLSWYRWMTNSQTTEFALRSVQMKFDLDETIMQHLKETVVLEKLSK